MSTNIGGTGISSLFNDPYSGAELEQQRNWRRFQEDAATRGQGPNSFPIDVDEDDDNIYIEADLPGYFREDIDVQIDGETLTISAERKRPALKTRRRHLSERLFASVNRSFVLPSSVDAERIEASMSNGVLTLVLPKREDLKSRLIQIRT